MPTAELITIGTELLLGEIVDTNTQYIARNLRDYGIDLFRATMVGDNPHRISQLMKEALTRADIVITTGGLGPTVDDPTREAAALAFDTTNEFHPELWEQIRQRFLKRSLNASDNNRKQAMIPTGAEIIPNPVGTAPSFILHKDGKTMVCLPGVPREMEYLLQISVLPWLRKNHDLKEIIKARVLHTAGVPESKVDELVGDLEELKNPTVGLLAHPGIVDIRITAKSESIQDADRMIQEVENVVRQRLGNDIFGVDGETLPQAVMRTIARSPKEFVVHVKGFSERAFEEIQHERLVLLNLNNEGLGTAAEIQKQTGKIIFTFRYQSTPEMASLWQDYSNGSRSVELKREYPGAEGLREEWAKHTSLNFIRQQLITNDIPKEKND